MGQSLLRRWRAHAVLVMGQSLLRRWRAHAVLVMGQSLLADGGLTQSW